MERLLVLRLESNGCAAQASVNGVPVALTGPGRSTCVMPVHEFATAGGNELTLTIRPTPPGQPDVVEPQLSEGAEWARLHLLLPRIGQTAHPDNARVLAALQWAPADGELFETPLRLSEQVDLPIAFPRWRWLDAPVVEDLGAAKTQVLKFLQRLAIDLSRGDPESFINAARLRFEDLALAYQRDVADEIGRWRLSVQDLRSPPVFKPVLPSMADLVVRPVAGGRLLECLTMGGQPALAGIRADGTRLSWPLRVAIIDGRLHVLR